jgi:limonene-1,2-epoxide hydrolase
MPTNSYPEPLEVVKRLHEAMNNHDLDAFVACFSPSYDSQQPVHPDRAFRGSEQVRKNWSTIFTDILDFHADLLRSAESAGIVWSEWLWHGTPAAGGDFQMRGVIIFGIDSGQIAWGRLYMGPVQQSGAGIDAAVRSMGQSTSGA